MKFEWIGGNENFNLYVIRPKNYLYEKHYRFLIHNLNKIPKNIIFESKICDIVFFVTEKNMITNDNRENFRKFYDGKFLDFEDNYWKHARTGTSLPPNNILTN